MNMQGSGGQGWGGGGYGGPPQGGYGGPPQGGYGGPPQGGYGGPPQGGYGGPPQGGYGGPPQGGFGGPPQGGYGGPPQGGFGGPPQGGFGGPVPGGGRAITERSAALVLVLSIVTCGIYLLFWLYNTSDELRRATNDTSINPTTDLLLTFVTCGLWSLVIQYRNVQKVHAALLPRQPQRKDQSQTVLLLHVASLFVGVTSLVALYLVQEEYNAMAREGF